MLYSFDIHPTLPKRLRYRNPEVRCSTCELENPDVHPETNPAGHPDCLGCYYRNILCYAYGTRRPLPG